MTNNKNYRRYRREKGNDENKKRMVANASFKKESKILKNWEQ